MAPTLFIIHCLDLISVAALTVGAEEDWGMIFFLEKNLQYDSKTSTLASKENIGTAVCHEISHQVLLDLKLGPHCATNCD